MLTYYRIRLVIEVFRYMFDTKSIRRALTIAEIMDKAGLYEFGIQKILTFPGGREFFEKRALVYGHKIEYYNQFPEGSLGKVYYLHLKAHDIDPNDFPMIEVVSHSSFLLNLIRQIHDVTHVVTGFSLNEIDELGLKAMEVKQMLWPLAFLAMGGGAFYILLRQPHKMGELVKAWDRGFRLADEMKPTILVNWNELWHLPLEEVKARLRVQKKLFYSPRNQRRKAICQTTMELDRVLAELRTFLGQLAV